MSSVLCVCWYMSFSLQKHFPGQFICMRHCNPYQSISASFCPQLLHLSFSLQQSTNSLSCQSKLTFMQPIFNDMIHLALSLISSLPLPSCWMSRATRSLITRQCCIQSLVGYRMDYLQPTNLNCNVSLYMENLDIAIKVSVSEQLNAGWHRQQQWENCHVSRLLNRVDTSLQPWQGFTTGSSQISSSSWIPINYVTLHFIVFFQP